MWVVIGGGMLMLLIAAMGRQRKDACRDYVISIQGVKGEDLFLDEKDIVKLLKAATKGDIKGQPRTAFDLANMEQLLAGNQWVKESQLYFDNKNVLHIKVTEREPVARVFTSGGRSFYFDATGMQMQLSDKVPARLPVFTGFPEKKISAKADSLLVSGLCTVADYIGSHPFWSAQVSQIDLVNAGPGQWEYDMIPLVGNHIIRLGDSNNMEQKLANLLAFYKQVLGKSGFGKYKTIDVRFKGQVVAAKSENPKVDAAELKKAVTRMLQQVKEAEKNSEEQAAMTTAKPEGEKKEEAKETSRKEPVADKPVKAESPKKNSVPDDKKSAEKKSSADPKPVEKNVPKAVMPARKN